MNGRRYTFRAPTNPLMQVLSLAVFALLVVAAVVLGAVILAVLVGVVAMAAAALAVRGWWLRRRLRGRDGAGDPPGTVPGGSGSHSGRVIDAEYVVIEHRPSDAESPDEQHRSKRDYSPP